MKVLYKIMWNRLTAIFAVWCLILTWCAFYSTNAYVNSFVLFFGFMAIILVFGYVLESNSQTSGEKWMLNAF